MAVAWLIPSPDSRAPISHESCQQLFETSKIRGVSHNPKRLHQSKEIDDVEKTRS
jgi:hypothetical protein